MGEEEMLANIENFRKNELERSKQDIEAMPDEVEVEEVDVYENNRRKRRENAKKRFPKGSSALVKAVTQSVINGDGAEGLSMAYKRAKNDSEYYKDKGEKDRQEIAKQQYMEEHFIPAIEVVVNYTSPDELLNCSEALRALDKYALGVGRTAGYTAAYVRQAYGDQLGQVNGKSDAVVIDEVRRIKKLADKGEIRVAVGIASRIKKQIDNGDRMADDDDYALIGRVAAYGS